jgi:hypothetical protein
MKVFSSVQQNSLPAFFNCTITIFFHHFSVANSKSREQQSLQPSLKKKRVSTSMFVLFYVSYSSYNRYSFLLGFFFCLSSPSESKSHSKTLVFKSKIYIVCIYAVRNNNFRKNAMRVKE